VLRQMGYDPFQAGAPLRLSASITRRRGQLTANLELRDADGKLIWENDRLSDPSDCQTLVRAMGVVLAIQLEPEPEPEPAPAPLECPPCPPPKPPEPPPPEVPKAAEPPTPAVVRRPDVLLGAGLLLGFEVPAAAAPGFSIAGAVRWATFSLDLEGRVVLPGKGVDQGLRIKTYAITAGIAPCVHFGSFFGCAVAHVGGLRLTGMDTSPRYDTYVLLSAGFRGGFEKRISERWLARGHADVLGTLLNHDAPGGTRAVWKVPGLAGLLGAEALLRF
jgi:hypothetical protein